jgi:hypothetical protein
VGSRILKSEQRHVLFLKNGKVRHKNMLRDTTMKEMKIRSANKGHEKDLVHLMHMEVKNMHSTL